MVTQRAMIRGFSTLEALIALMIIATTLVAVILVAFGTPNVLMSARMHREAAALASAGIMRTMARGPHGFSLDSVPLPSPDSQYATMLVTSPIGDESLKHVESIVKWVNGREQEQSMTIEAFITDYMSAASNVCAGPLIGNWESPQLAPYRPLPPLRELPPIDAISASKDRLVATATTTQGAQDPSFFVFDISSGTRLTDPVGSFDHSTSTKVGYSDVAVSGEYAYALTSHESCPPGTVLCARLDILSLDSPTVTRIGSMPLPPARSILYRAGFAYVGLRRSALWPEFLVIDVRDPVAPTRIGDAEIGVIVNDIVTDGATAYLATGDSSAAGNKAVMAFDVRSPESGMVPIQTAWYGGLGMAQRLALSGSTLYLGRVSPDALRDLYTLDPSDITAVLDAEAMDSSVTGIAIRGFLAFALTKTRLESWRVDKPNDLRRFAGPVSLPSGMTGTGLACSGNRLYIAAAAGPTGMILTVAGS